MAELWNNIWHAAGVAGAGVTRLLGGWDGCLHVLLVMMGLDYLSALVLGWMGKSPKSQNGAIDSRVGFRGLLRKALVLIILAVAAQIDVSLNPSQHLMRNGVAWFYIANEAISLLENIGQAGIPLPQRLRGALGQLEAREP